MESDRKNHSHDSDTFAGQEPGFGDPGYVPDEWDSIFQDYDNEADQREEETQQKEYEEKQHRRSMARELLGALRDILDRGAGYERLKEVKQLFGKGPEGFSKGDPDIFQKMVLYTKEPEFLKGFRDLCESHEIDKPTYTQFLKVLYPGDLSENVTDMRKYLMEKRKEAPYRPLKKMNFPLAAIAILLVFGYEVALGTPRLYAAFPAAWVGIHWFLYRKLHHRYGGSGTHMRLSFLGLLVLFLYGERIVPKDVTKNGVFFVTSFYIDLAFITAVLSLSEFVRKRMKYGE